MIGLPVLAGLDGKAQQGRLPRCQGRAAAGVQGTWKERSQVH